MTDPDKNPPTVWQELVQRRVVRVAIFYGAIAWLLVQVADVVLEAFDADAALKYVIAAALAGFPVALVLSWMFDVTPQGLVRTPPRARESTRRSIAVLPFANLSGDAENEYFSDGLADEIRDRISQVPGVRVAARSSSSVFKGTTADAREIGARLSVGLLLEGGVRKYGNTLRISAQLVDAEQGYQLWSQSFERRLEDVFAVQSEIAHAILDAVHVRVSDTADAGGRPASFDAYNLYLLGRYHFHKRTEASLQLAVRYFQRAIEADEAYAQAYSGLADATCLLGTGFYGNLNAADALAQAVPAAQRALQLAPQSPEAQASIGLIRYQQQDLDGAAAAFERALELNPNYTLAHVWLGLVYTSKGQYAEAARRNAEVLRLDPLSPIVNANAGFDDLRHGRHAAAEARFRNGIEIDPSFPVAYSGMARLSLVRGQLEEAMRWQEQAIERAPTVTYYTARKGYLFLLAGQETAAREWFEAARRGSIDRSYLADILAGMVIAGRDTARLRAVAADPDSFGPAQRALATLVLGEPAESYALYTEAELLPEAALIDIVNFDKLWTIPHVLYRTLAASRAGADAGTAAIDEMLAACHRLWAQDVINGDLHYWAAMACVLLGRREEAIGQLETAVARGWLGTWWARCDPCFDALRDDPRCEKLLAAAEAHGGSPGAPTGVV